MKFSKTPFDEEFRRAVGLKLATARKEVIVVTGEGSAFIRYLDLQWVVRDAVLRGVKFRIYCNGISPGPARKLLNWGCEIIQGDEKVRDHFMIVDRKEAGISRAHERWATGQRKGYFSTRGIGALLKRFSVLKAAGRKITKPDGLDPLDEFLGSPVDFGVQTGASSIDAGLFREN